MRKRERHQLIKKMITEEKLGTQKEIQDRLEAQNVYVTQTLCHVICVKSA